LGSKALCLRSVHMWVPAARRLVAPSRPTLVAGQWKSWGWGCCLATAADPPPALVLVDGKQSQELVKAELSRRLAANAQGVDILTAGRQGITVALYATAELGREGGSARRPREFRLRKAGHDELTESGLEPPANSQSAAAADEGGLGRGGFRLSFVPRGSPEAVPWSSPIQKVLRVSGGTGQVMPLAKAIATEVFKLPEGKVSVVETAIRGKAKNVWTRIHRMAQSVALADEWQKSTNKRSRCFRCVVDVVQTKDDARDPLGKDAKADKEDLLGSSHEFRVVRLTLMPEGPPHGQ